jgi:hypothetical protein
VIGRVIEKGLDFDIRVPQEEFPDDRWNHVGLLDSIHSNGRYYR